MVDRVGWSVSVVIIMVHDDDRTKLWEVVCWCCAGVGLSAFSCEMACITMVSLGRMTRFPMRNGLMAVPSISTETSSTGPLLRGSFPVHVYFFQRPQWLILISSHLPARLLFPCCSNDVGLKALYIKIEGRGRNGMEFVEFIHQETSIRQTIMNVLRFAVRAKRTRLIYYSLLLLLPSLH